MLIRFLWVAVYPTVTSGGSASTEGDEVMGFVQAWIGVAAEPTVVDTVRLVADRFSAADAPIMVTLQYCGTGRLVRLFFTHGEYCS